MAGTKGKTPAMTCRFPAASSADVAWLAQVREMLYPLSDLSPIYVRPLESSLPVAIEPQQHPYCELAICTAGAGVQYVGRDHGPIAAGTALILAPGVPHWFQITKYPHRGVAVYFLPNVLIEAGSPTDGVALLRQFTAGHAWTERVSSPSRKAFQNLLDGMKRILKEFEGDGFARKARLRALLIEMLVQLFRARRDLLPAFSSPSDDLSSRLQRALRFLGTHHRRTIYGREVAAAAGVSESSLRTYFRKGLGMSWVHYLQSYRIHRAVELLQLPGASVQDVALEVGFESLSHFNVAFRAFTHLSPRQKSAARSRLPKT